jgi:hypothetical protein
VLVGRDVQRGGVRNRLGHYYLHDLLGLLTGFGHPRAKDLLIGAVHTYTRRARIAPPSFML